MSSNFRAKHAKDFKVSPPIKTIITLDRSLYGSTSNPLTNQGQPKSAFVFSWDFQSQLVELLTNPNVFGNVNKLVVNKDNPWSRYVPDPNDGGEILSSLWMNRTYDYFERNILNFSWDTHQIHPIIIYDDKTGTDSRQKYSSEPWMFCHAGIKRCYRNDPFNWRPLGYIPDLNFFSSAERRVIKGRKGGASTSHLNYMSAMEPIVASLETAMKGGFRAMQRIGNEFRMMQHHVVIAFVMGDSSSSTNLCSTFVSSKATRICRFCDVTFKDCDRHGIQCSFLKMDHLKNLSSNFFRSTNVHEKEYLTSISKQISVHICHNPWFDLDYGGTFGCNTNRHDAFI